MATATTLEQPAEKGRFDELNQASDFERRYRAVESRDARFDGWFFTAVTSTGIYCRPSCPALTPKRANVRFFPTAAAAQASGFRACLRCRPDAAPGSPAWQGRADVVARAVRLIADGTVEREGVSGLAGRLGYSERQLQRLLVAELGTGAIALARSQRAQTARVLLETTDLPAAHVAFAAGFASVRQFNDTVRSVFATTPTGLRQRRRERQPGSPGSLTVRLPHRTPMDAAALFAHLGDRAVPGIEEVVVDQVAGPTYRRSLALPLDDGTVTLTCEPGALRATFALGDLRDLSAAVSRCRRLGDLDADPVAVDRTLAEDPVLAPLVAARPGLRSAGSVDGAETALRVVLGQQVSLASARRAAGRLVAAAGRPLDAPAGGVTHTFPAPARVAALVAEHPEALGLPESRRRTLGTLSLALAEDRLTLGPGADPAEAADGLARLPGVGPWSVAMTVLRALGDPDVWIPEDLGIRRALGRHGLDPATGRPERWRPWRSYAMAHLWAEPAPATPHPRRDRRPRGATP